MKPFAALKFSAPLLGLGAFLLLAPAAHAQSEIAPDHFDGTDPWEIALAAKTRPTKTDKPFADSALHGVNKKSNTHSGTPQLTPAKDASQSQRPELLAVERKRRPSSAKPNNP